MIAISHMISYDTNHTYTVYAVYFMDSDMTPRKT